MDARPFQIVAAR